MLEVRDIEGLFQMGPLHSELVLLGETLLVARTHSLEGSGHAHVVNVVQMMEKPEVIKNINLKANTNFKTL